MIAATHMCLPMDDSPGLADACRVRAEKLVAVIGLEKGVPRAGRSVCLASNANTTSFADHARPVDS
jgi:hypothetical protein